jgi:hypothetical protein
MKGIGTLERPEDLLEKLRHDLVRIRGNRTDSYAAFDFFVTAEHMLDWVLPGSANGAERKARRQSSQLLQIVSHLANGSKHFVAEAKHHQSVQHVDVVGGAFDPRAFNSAGFDTGELFVTLEQGLASSFGASVSVAILAEQVLGYWEGQLSPSSGRPTSG